MSSSVIFVGCFIAQFPNVKSHFRLSYPVVDTSRTIQAGPFPSVTELQEVTEFPSPGCAQCGAKAVVLACAEGRVCSARGTQSRCCRLPCQASLPVGPLLFVGGSLGTPCHFFWVSERGRREVPCKGTVFFPSQTLHHRMIFCFASFLQLSPSLKHVGLGEGEWSQQSLICHLIKPAGVGASPQLFSLQKMPYLEQFCPHLQVSISSQDNRIILTVTYCYLVSCLFFMHLLIKIPVFLSVIPVSVWIYVISNFVFPYMFVC